MLPENGAWPRLQFTGQNPSSLPVIRYKIHVYLFC